MKIIVRCLFALVIMLQCSVLTSRAQPAAADGIVRAIRSGNAGDIVRLSGNTVDITINNNQATYSRTQGELVLRDFFSRNAVRDYVIEHTGTSAASNSMFTIGTLSTASGKYRVYVLLRQSEGGYSLTELRLQK